MDAHRRVDPRIRAHGRARIDITRNARNEADWRERWKAPKYDFPFEWGEGWVHSIEYKVDDFAAEVGFFIDVLALPVAAFSPSYAFFSGPKGEFAFGLTEVQDGELSTPPDSLRLQFNVKYILDTVEELESRGVVFECKPYPAGLTDEDLQTTYFRTPHGVCIDLLGRGERQENDGQDDRGHNQGMNNDFNRSSGSEPYRDSNESGSNGGLPFKDISSAKDVQGSWDDDTPGELEADKDDEALNEENSIIPGLEPFSSDNLDQEPEGGQEYLDEAHQGVRKKTRGAYTSHNPGKWPRTGGSPRRHGSGKRDVEIKYVQLDDTYPEE